MYCYNNVNLVLIASYWKNITPTQTELDFLLCSLHQSELLPDSSCLHHWSNPAQQMAIAVLLHVPASPLSPQIDRKEEGAIEDGRKDRLLGLMLNFTAHGLRISEPWSWWTAGGGGGAVYWCLTSRKWFRMFTVQAFSLVQLWQHVGWTPFACTSSCSSRRLAHLICNHGASEIFVFKNMPWKRLCNWISCLSLSLWLSNRLQANPLTSKDLRIKQTQKTWVL